ncbi:F420H(2):quinone oxidoreductase [Leptospira perolatii]|uniref:F420H(2):quinone oxidoreductase n=1 Tax=Leptospira perolatii TaxID=2023191 RepID=A0A2M9ZSS1_9LEPT|nr:NAD(P)-binding domain-containing protein [Leptospira perolatii]PJZ68765.1 F420H(2):quinone oxidoreductase [Leptospira perolatii]PJZ75120.1 F420H(2):quinone oxidoreductase [Leptospira perolatii]
MAKKSQETAIKDKSDHYCIIGAGPAGLAMARSFLLKGVPFDVFEKHSDVGGIWDPKNQGSPIYKSAHFISSKTLSGYFDFPMPEEYPDYPSNQLILQYHKSFAKTYHLYDHVTFNMPIQNIVKEEKGWIVTLKNGEKIQYKGVVCATGITWDPNQPTLPGRFNGEQMHSVKYDDPSIFKGKKVLIIGAGNSGCDIACDAATTADNAFISVRRGYYFIPKHIFGVPADVFGEGSTWMPAWMSTPIFEFLLNKIVMGDLRKVGLPKPDHHILETHPIANDQLIHNLRHGNIQAKPDVTRLDGDFVEFKDGSREKVDLIVYATGYNWSIPYMDKSYFIWRGGRPDLYLSLFSRDHEDLYALGYMETDGGAYKMYDEMADLISSYVASKRNGSKSEKKFKQLIEKDHPVLNGGVKYLKIDRNAVYVNKHAYLGYLKKLRRNIGWSPLKPGMYESLKNSRKSSQQEKSNFSSEASPGMERQAQEVAG